MTVKMILRYSEFFIKITSLITNMKNLKKDLSAKYKNDRPKKFKVYIIKITNWKECKNA